VPAARRCDGEQRRFARVTRKCVPERGLDPGFVGEQEREVRNASRGSGGGDSGRRRRPVVRGGIG
jgi:hypothetical protein